MTVTLDEIIPTANHVVLNSNSATTYTSLVHNYFLNPDLRDAALGGIVGLFKRFSKNIANVEYGKRRRVGLRYWGFSALVLYGGCSIINLGYALTRANYIAPDMYLLGVLLGSGMSFYFPVLLVRDIKRQRDALVEGVLGMLSNREQVASALDTNRRTLEEEIKKYEQRNAVKGE